MSKEIRPYMRMPLGWRETDEVVGLSSSAKDLLMALVEHCQVRRNGGVMNEMQVRLICRTLERGHWALAQLISAGVLKMMDGSANQTHTSSTPDAHQRQTKRTPDAHQTQTSSTPTAKVELVYRRSARGVPSECVWCAFVKPSFWFISGSSTAGQGTDEEPRARSRPPARVGALAIREERVEEEDRTPSGSVRSSSARAAPRSAGGAARPAPKREEDQEDDAFADGGDLDGRDDRVAEDDGPMSGAEARRAIRKAISKSSLNSGKPAAMRKYPMELNSLAEPSLPVELNGHYE